MGRYKLIKSIMFFVGLMVICTGVLDADFRFAKELYDDALYDEAISEFQQVISDYPTSIEAENSLFYIGESYRAQGKYDLAENSFNRIWQAYPSSDYKDRTLFYLALTQKNLGKYNLAYDNFNLLLNKYPLSNYAQQSLKDNIETLFNKGDYNHVIDQGIQMTTDYPGNKQLPDILFLIAKAELALENYDKADQIIAKIKSEYPQSNAFWDVTLLDIEQQFQKGKTETAINELKAKLNEEIPRFFEEKYLAKLVDYLIENNNYSEALNRLNFLISKFNNSLDLDKYLTQKLMSQSKSGQIENIDTTAELPRELNDSNYTDSYLFYLAEIDFQKGDYKMMEARLNQLILNSDDIPVVYQSKLLKAKAYQEQGRYTEAVTNLNTLVGEKWAEENQIDMIIANIYYHNLKNFSQAIRYYDKVITDYDDYFLKAEASYKKSLCYEELEDFNAAVNELNMIDLMSLSDEVFINKVKSRKSYLRKFKVVDYKKAFSNLISSLFDYSNTDNKEQLKSDLIKILANDIKDFSTTKDLIEPITPSDYYLKAGLLINLAEKYDAESALNSRNSVLNEVDELISYIDQTTHKEWVEELSIKKELIQENNINTILKNHLESFINNYSDSDAANEFMLKLIDYYRQNNEMEKAVIFQEKLQWNEHIDSAVFYDEKIALAEYYYNRDEDQKAKENYEIAEDVIGLNRPEILFHFAVVLDQLEYDDEAESKLEFLLNNANSFPSYSRAIHYFTDYLVDKQNFQKAITYFNRIPHEDRDNIFYEKSSIIYQALGRKEEAKVALMHIQNKSTTHLKDLARLQYETNDLTMAQFTYEQLIEKLPDDLHNYYMAGHIFFINEKYLEAAKKYKVIVDKLGDDFNEFEMIKNVALENIIALYRIENRPKAETLEDKFDSVLDDRDKQKIRLNEGIYYLKIDAKKSTKIFAKIIKKPADNNLKYQAYFWRGVANLKLKNEVEAEADFMVILESNNRQLMNQAALKLGTLKFSQENFDKALDYYYEVISHDESGKYALDAANNFAYICKIREEWQKAVAAYEIILDKWGDKDLEGKTLFDIAYCHFRDRKYGQSIDMFNRAIPLLNDREMQAEAQYWKGEAYFNMEDYSEAVTEFLKVGYSYDDFVHWAASSELRAADAYENQDDIVKAKRLYQRVIDKYGQDSQWGKMAVSKLEQYK